MKISAEGKTALIVNGQGKVGQAIAAALTASGATIVEATAGDLDLFAGCGHQIGSRHR